MRKTLSAGLGRISGGGRDDGLCNGPNFLVVFTLPSMIGNTPCSSDIARVLVVFVHQVFIT